MTLDYREKAMEVEIDDNYLKECPKHGWIISYGKCKFKDHLKELPITAPKVPFPKL